MQVRKRGLDTNERTDLWRRWRAGQTLSDIARALCKPPGSVFGYVKSNGGISPLARTRRPSSLTMAEREDISRGLGREESFRTIAARLRRSVSSIAREVARNGGSERYRATEADAAAWSRARRPKVCKLAKEMRLQRCVAFKLSQNWSPEQISGWLEQRYPDDERMRISHETIYRSLFIQARGVLKKELQVHLRTRRKFRRAKSASTKGQMRGQIIDAVSISKRPPEADDRAIPVTGRATSSVGQRTATSRLSSRGTRASRCW